ncbi:MULTISPECIES: FecR family protein [Chryseobacterium]|uniref:FecR family protein n=1 Tax=Chryseobacterium TaxID=59732 RepID=UPI00195C4AF4|nr:MULTISPECIES: FecR domain-containing protein [Chryseobacterium]MBM7419468.1 ferric-dicitrate binding protein FerR (iron transport regulator) [Chryseobacterium sp. JUb44]MDH6209396.1 transmembrane sensor [Chryseobacterium sp. BIGb0186]WSO12232.1 FecR domain-containing protein [Chryseobacterium scophthalmum]
MRNLNYKDIQAFVFRLWQREVSDETISEKETELLNQWKINVEKDLNSDHILESKARVLLALESYLTQTTYINHPNGFRKYFYQIAAVIILLFSVGGIFSYNTFFKPDVYVAEKGNQKVYLKDGSVVTLFPGAELSVERSFPADTRVVALKGDAIFSVAKSKKHPFIVRADGFSTKVLGTVFKITQSGNDKAVDLYEGKVAVSYVGVPVTFLKPNQKWTNFGVSRTAAVISFTKANTSTQKLPSLLSLSFNDVMLKDVAEVLQKNYSISIIYPKELAEKKITADFTGGNTDENIEALAFILDLEVQKEKQTYIFKK